jgi:hypothetical protein
MEGVFHYGALDDLDVAPSREGALARTAVGERHVQPHCFTRGNRSRKIDMLKKNL